MKTSTLYNKKTALAFYEERYAKHYMSEWPKEKKQRVFNLIKSLPLPEYGSALDFGCGNGIFTDLLKQALPRWEVYGCDISKTSIENAKSRFPECKFFVSNDEVQALKKFDFLFTHHVLEHVYDIQTSIKEIVNYLQASSYMFHILPCGNEGSFEYHVSDLTIDGINSKMENRFFFEDEGHVRRLTTKHLTEIIEPHGYILAKEFYANHKFGSMEWITRSTIGFIKGFADPQKGKDTNARSELMHIRQNLIKQYILRFPSSIFIKAKDPSKPAIRYFILAIGYIPYLLGLFYYKRLLKKTEEEWSYQSTERNGSEMYLFYEKKKV
jgi:SAM-dependent methyltransferase